MNQTNIKVKRALISVSDKTGIVEFARALVAKNIEIISTGGTSQLLREANIPVRDVSDVTGFPEMMHGRLKTLHPKVHGGILGQRDEHAAEAKAHDIGWIDLVVVNLYPFSTTIKKPGVTEDEAIENIDIGGPTMIRAAAKNRDWVGVVVDPNDYANILNELSANNELSEVTRKQMAIKAFGHTAQYDTLIHDYFMSGQDEATKSLFTQQPQPQNDASQVFVQQSKTQNDASQSSLSQQSPSPVEASQSLFPQQFRIQLSKLTELRYGENPHQKAAAYKSTDDSSGILSAKQHQGKQLSYNNIMDADAALICVNEFKEPACVIVKHANPCGVALASTLQEAFVKAFNADAMSAFGGIVALNKPCDAQTADAMKSIFFEVIIAPGFSAEALNILAAKPNLRVLEVKNFSDEKMEFKYITGGMLVQEKDHSIIQPADLKVVTKREPSEADIATMLFAWPVLKQMKSNAILIAKDQMTVGIGVGQVSRVDAVGIALKKARQNLAGTILASDAFFPFRDSIDLLADSGIRGIIQPGGSMRDEEVIAACDEHEIAMVFTGKRCFKH